MESSKTLMEYYEELPTPTPPKTEFIERVAKRCGLRDATVRLWVKGKNKPSNEEWLQILSEESGIPVPQLFKK